MSVRWNGLDGVVHGVGCCVPAPFIRRTPTLPDVKTGQVAALLRCLPQVLALTVCFMEDGTARYFSGPTAWWGMSGDVCTATVRWRRGSWDGVSCGFSPHGDVDIVDRI